MPDIRAQLTFLSNSPLYEIEKPYSILLPEQEQGDSIRHDLPRCNNLEWSHHWVDIREARRRHDLTLEACGFQLLRHTSQSIPIREPRDVTSYRLETEELLQTTFAAERAICYDVVLRQNVRDTSSSTDLRDPMSPHPPAFRVHNDATPKSGVDMIERHLPHEIREMYPVTRYRYRIVKYKTTYGLGVDSPLAVCDYRSIADGDLVAVDKVTPSRVGEVYYLKHNDHQAW
ncbi:methyltransferase [Cladophialophora carrionii]|uniref:Methyltransferase n=1 Tax=Cladophialophora carrionii TaxID=86049 RepID=A0A1C1CCZ9_9EURO|nr:methyltransferase [Cladophialophora carrionii]